MPAAGDIRATNGEILPLTVKKKEGRPLVFDAAAQSKFLEGIALGIPRVRCAHLAGVPWPTASAYIQRHPEFQQRLDTAEAEAEAYFASSIKRAAGKDHPIAALAWLGRRRPEDWAERGRVEHGHAHVHALSPNFAAALASLNVKSADGILNVDAESVDTPMLSAPSLSSESIGHKKARRVPRYSKRPTPPRLPAIPPPPSATHNTPQKIATKNKKGSDASTTATNENPQESPQQAA